jgi:hypothetical protein
VEPGREPDLVRLSVRVCGSGCADEVLRSLVAGLLGSAPAEVVLGHRPSGAPVVLRPAGEVEVSLSRGPAMSAVAAGRGGPVGVDVERLRPLPAAALARRWFAAAEAEWVERLPADRQAAAFLALWTQKEAVGKALGTGLAGGGRHRPVPRPDPLGTELVLVPVPDAPGLAVGVCARDGVLLAVCGPVGAGAPELGWERPGG